MEADSGPTIDTEMTLSWRARRKLLARSFVGLAVVALLAIVGIAASQGSSDPQEPSARASAAGESETSEAESAGAQVYARHCSVCHGDTGLGLEEARDAFPDDHRRCTRCHRPGNPPTMSYSQVEARQHDLFDIGIAPAVLGSDSMAAQADRDALERYIAATMPRWNPGALTAAEYDAVTEFLLELNGR